MKEIKVYVKEMPDICDECPFQDKETYKCILLPKYAITPFLQSCPHKSLHDHDKELVAKVLGMVREDLKEELLLTKNENQEEAKLKLVKTYSIDLDVLNKIEKEILNGYTKI